MKKGFSVGKGVLVPLLGVFLTPPVFCTLIPPEPEQKLIARLTAKDDFRHDAGKAGYKGWEVDYKRDKPGYLLSHLHDPLLLEPGLYRATFLLRRGNYPNKGLFNHAYGVFRLEVWDITEKELIVSRELQMADFSGPNKYEKRWVEFSMRGRQGHGIEPRVYWMGLANGEVEAIKITRFPEVSLRELEAKAERIGGRLERENLENGFVVSRKPSGNPDETGDAITYTGFYLASLAWKYAVTNDALTYQALENAIQTLHKAKKGTFDQPVLTRFVDEDGNPFPKNPSKDVYTSFFLAYGTALPMIMNPALKKQMIQDLDQIATKFLQDDLTVKMRKTELMSLAPHFTENEIQHGIRKLITRERSYRKFMKALKQARTYFPFAELWPGMKDTLKALKKKNEEQLMELVVPTLNGMALLGRRARDILREQYREDLFLRRDRNNDYPGKKLEQILTASLHKFPQERRKVEFKRLSDLRVLASNALIALHIIRTAHKHTQEPPFEEYYRNNLYTQDALLKTALDWDGLEEDLFRLTAGNPAADRARRGYLSALSLYNLIQMEPNPFIQESYQTLLERWWKSYRHEDNPLAAALYAVGSTKKDTGLRPEADFILRALALYPEDTSGFGAAYWKENGEEVGNRLAGGVLKGYAREPVPISHRPKDSFLWQRNARRLKGDFKKDYPGTDYLFLYWFSRYHGLIPDTPPEPTVHR